MVAPHMRDAHIPVVRCDTCDLVQMQRIPSATELAAFYDQGKQAVNIGVSVDIDRLWIRQKDDTVRRATNAQNLAPKGSRILDIGSGYGFFLREMKKKGYPIEGIEVSDVSRDISAKVTRARVHDIDIGAASEEELSALGTFEIITMFHCLEHIPDPVAFLKRVRTLLSPKGTLFIEVPNIDDAALDLSAGYRAFYWQFAHCSYFNAKTLARTLKKAGFKKVAPWYEQRYGLENLMGWMVAGKPQLNAPSYATAKAGLKSLEQWYKKDRIKNGTADTLLALARS